MADFIKTRGTMVVLTIALAVAACSPAPQVSQSASDGAFTVTVSVPSGTHHASDALGVLATLTYEGPQPSVIVGSGDEGLVWFSFKQLDGSLAMDGSLSRLICSPSTAMVRGSPATFRPAKSVAYGADDPNAAFYGRWASDADVHLPAGRWQIVATAQIWDGETCMGATPSHVITVPPLLVDVVP